VVEDFDLKPGDGRSRMNLIEDVLNIKSEYDHIEYY